MESSKFSADRWFSLRMAAAKMAASSVCGDVAGESDMELPMVALLVDAKQGTRNVAEDDPPGWRATRSELSLTKKGPQTRPGCEL